MKNKKQKIVYIIPWFFIGGAERVFIDLVIRINKEKFDIKIITLKKSLKGKNGWQKKVEENKIKIVLIEKKSKLGLSCLYDLYKYLKNEKPDVVHTQLFLADFFGRLAGKLAGVKNIVSVEHNINFSEGKLKMFLKKITARFATKIIVVSDAIGDYAKKYEGAKSGQIEKIYNGIEVHKFQDFKKYEEKRSLIIGTVGRLVGQKGFDILIQSMVRVQNRARLKIIGDGEKRSELEELTRRCKLEGRVELIGQSLRVDNFLKTIDIFVQPSRWEGLGISVLEAGASGLPVIGSNVDGLKEIIENNKNGLLFNSESVSDLANKINLLASNNELRKKLGRNLQKKVIDNFDIKKMVKKYEKIYENITSQ